MGTNFDSLLRSLTRRTWEAWLSFRSFIQLIHNPSLGVNKILRIKTPPSTSSDIPPSANANVSPPLVPQTAVGPLQHLSPIRAAHTRDYSPQKTPPSLPQLSPRAAAKSKPRTRPSPVAKGPVIER